MKTVLRIILAIIIAMFVLAVAGSIGISITEQLDKSYSWTTGPFTHTGMLVISFILILLLSRGKVSTYGIKTIEKKQLNKPIQTAAIVSSIVLVVLSGLGYLSGLLPPESDAGPAVDMTFIQIVIFIWIYASICEEVLFRGLIQGFLAPLKEKGFSLFDFRISLPVLIAALGFGLMHLMLLSTGMDLYPVLMIVIAGIILGLIAGHYREAAGSIIPAIVVHMVFNIIGTVIALLESLLE